MPISAVFAREDALQRSMTVIERDLNSPLAKANAHSSAVTSAAIIACPDISRQRYHRGVLAGLGKHLLLALDMRLGEGSGAATFGQAGVERKDG